MFPIFGGGGAAWPWCWYCVTWRWTGWLTYHRIMFPIFGGGGSLAVVLVPGHQAVDRLAHLLRTVAVLAGLSLTVATAHYGFTVSSCIEAAVLCGPRIRVADPHRFNADPGPGPYPALR
jgi:hypothetical protein